MARNLLLSSIRNYLADHVVYQSWFARDWWHREAGSSRQQETVIYNGVDLNQFAPPSFRKRPGAGEAVLVCIEGEVPSDPAALAILKAVARDLVAPGVIGEARVYGHLPTRNFPTDELPGVRFESAIARSQVPSVLAESDVFLSLDINGACPNAVIESLAAGVPVVAFDSGALSELISEEAGVVLPYGADPWKLEPPDTRGLADSVSAILEDLPTYREGARRSAEMRFGIGDIGNLYMETIRSLVYDRS